MIAAGAARKVSPRNTAIRSAQPVPHRLLLLHLLQPRLGLVQGLRQLGQQHVLQGAGAARGAAGVGEQAL